ncbi:DUF2489 domain-containing protein [Alloalcanivorax mobilis]|uniref:DUF2489 domain-containing protein n=1 Tax=Alloalcanivorax mobilis TaxID=2019569 RepID=UPI000C789DDF|nr:DUF2489 domain-containing protein [Alloalcanivorax mobilis]
MAWKLVLAALLGLAIGAALGALAWRWMARRQRRRDQARRYREILDSLGILCRALLENQVESSEASIRISVLLDCLPGGLQPRVDVAALHRLAHDCAVFHRGENRRQLSRVARDGEDRRRRDLELAQAPAVRAATQRLAGVIDDWRLAVS